MPAAASIDDVRHAVEVEPGLTRAALARRIGGRRERALRLVDDAVAHGAVREDTAHVPARGGSWRTVRGLYAGESADVAASPTSPGPLSAGDLRARREAAGVSVKALARQLRVTRQLVQSWEAARQAVPGWVGGELEEALQVAASLPARSRGTARHARYLRELVDQVQAEPGISRWRLVRQTAGRIAALEHAIAAGMVHEASSVVRAGRQPRATSVFPGPRPRVSPLPVRIGDLRAARLDAGWSQDVMAARLGIARTTLERWEADRDLVPAYATAAGRRALAEARAKARNDTAETRAVVLREVERRAAGVTRKQLMATTEIGWRRQMVATVIDGLVADGLVHEAWAGRTGQRLALFAGPAPAPALSGAQLRALRERAGLLQRDVAGLTGVGVQKIRDWERGAKPMTTADQGRLRQLLEAQPDEQERLRLAVLAALPATRRQLHLRVDASRGEVDQAVAELVDDGRIEWGRVRVPTTTGALQLRRGLVATESN